jgi:hypothetical protein
MKRILGSLPLTLALLVAAPASMAGIRVYAEKDYKGDSIEIDKAIKDLRELDFDDRISSLQADEAWLVCSAPKFKGDCREVEGEHVSLRDEGLNDRITSLRPAKKQDEKKGEKETGTNEEPVVLTAAAPAPAPAPAATPAPEWWGGAVDSTAFAEVRRAGRGGRVRIQVFEEREYVGRWRRFTGPVSELDLAGGPLVIRSAILENGPWEICTQPAFQGDCRILHDSTVDLDDWSERIGSLRPAQAEAAQAH